MISIFKKILYAYRLKLAKKRVLSFAIIGNMLNYYMDPPKET